MTGVASFWAIAGGLAWAPVAAAIAAWVVPRGGGRTLSRPSGGACLLGAALGLGLLVLLLLTTGDLSQLPWTVAHLAVRAGLVAFLFAFAARVEPGRDVLGLAPGSPGRDLARGAGIYAAFVPVVIAAHVLNAIIVGGDAESVQKPVRDVLSQDGPARLALIVNLVVAVPLFEELVFRGFLQQGVKAQLALVASPRNASLLSVVVASVAFTAFHDTFTYVPVFVLSLILGSAFERSGRILVPVALHALHNLAVVIWASLAQSCGGGP
jgi:membrane protease YdiL (CAAX protease family)